MARSHHPGGLVQRSAVPAATAALGLADVDRHAHAEPVLDLPPGPGQRGLRRDRRRDRIVDRLERRGERVAGRGERRAAVLVDRGAHEEVVLGEVGGHRVGVLGPQPRRARRCR